MASDGVLMTVAAARGAGFLLLWLVLAGFHAGDLPAIVVAVGVATWASLRLLPPRPGRISLSGLAWLALRFPGQSLLAGIDVAARALNPRLKLRPGLVVYRPALPQGVGRDAFCALASLMPGTLPADTDADGALLVHCLDIDQPVLAQLRTEETLFMHALGKRLGDG